LSVLWRSNAAGSGGNASAIGKHKHIATGKLDIQNRAALHESGNAGVIRRASVLETSEEEWDRVMFVTGTALIVDGGGLAR
jgi:hypothetical protein